MIKAIIFDAFGTLIDTKDGSVRATEGILKRNNCDLDPKEVYSKWKKYHLEYIQGLKEFIKDEDIFLMDLERIFRELGIKGNAKEDVNIMLKSQTNRSIFPETNEAILELRKKYRVYIGSNTDNEPLLINLKNNNINVDGFFTSEMLRTYKPSREFFIKMLKELNYNTDEVIYVGDSQIDDIKGAKAAGISVVWINRKGQALREDIPKPDYEIHDLREMLEEGFLIFSRI